MTNINARTRLKFLVGAAGFLLIACGGGGSSNSPQAPVIAVPPPPVAATPTYVPPNRILRDTFRNNFFVGAAISAGQLAEPEAVEILKSQFSSITAEFEMKPQDIAPTEGVYDWTASDALVNFAKLNNIQIRGHALVWHDSTPDYFFEGTDAEIKARLEDYITTVMTRYKGHIRFWDVVNEVITDDDNAAIPYRQSNWYEAVGPAYIDWAFEAARAADPSAFLFINDYSTELPEKRARLLTVVQDLKDRNIPLDGVGHQMHLFAPKSLVSDVLQAVDDVDNMFEGLTNHITELDINVYADPGSCYETGTNCDPDYGDALPAELARKQAQMYRDLFQGFEARSSVKSVTVWGLKDSDSWLNTNPVTRTNYPLLYDRDGNAKPAFRAIVDKEYKIP